MIGIQYKDFNKKIKQHSDARQAAKPGNFMFPGGGGVARFVSTQRSQGPDTPCVGGPHLVKDDSGNFVEGYYGLRFCILMDGAKACGTTKVMMWKDRKISPTCEACLECGVRLKNYWLRQWTEYRAYFKFIDACIQNGQEITDEMLMRWPWLQSTYTTGQRLDPGQIMQHHSGRLRGGLDYCSMANGFFQSLLSEAIKRATCRVSRECYDRTVIVPDMVYANSIRSAYANGPSPLLGSRMVVLQHDELITDHDEDTAHDAATRVSEIMVNELRFYCPDVADACAAEPALMFRWNKEAKTVRDSNGKLIPWQPNN